MGLGPGGQGAQAGLNLATYWNAAAPGQSNCQIVATDDGHYGCTFQISTLRTGLATNPLKPRIQINPNGSMAFPTMPQNPVPGSDLEIDSQGNLGVQVSSVRFKEAVEPLSADIHNVLALRPKQFRYKGSDRTSIGYLAEDVDELGLEHLLTRDAENQPLGVNYKLLSVYLLELVREQQAAIDDLRREVSGKSAA